MVYSMLVIPAQRQKGDQTLKAILGYITNSMPTQGNITKSCPQKTKQTNKITKNEKEDKEEEGNNHGVRLH